MQKFGYLEGSEDGSAAQPLLDDVAGEKFLEAIKEVQRFGGLEVTGELDEKTIEVSAEVDDYKKMIINLFILSLSLFFWWVIILT